MLYALLAGGHLSFGFALQAANQLRLVDGSVLSGYRLRGCR